MSDKDELLNKNNKNEEETVVNEETGTTDKQELEVVQNKVQENAIEEEPVREEVLAQPQAGSEMSDKPASSGLMKLLPWGITAVAVIALIVVLVTKPGGDQEAVATVNGENVTRQQLNDYMLDQVGKQALNVMIQDTLINQEVAKAGVTITDADVEAELESFKKGFPSENEFTMYMMQNGLALENLKDQLEANLKITKVLEPTITIKDEDIKKYYDENKDSFATPEQVQASHILVDKKEDAEAILKQLKDGADFATIAKEKNKDATKEKGGDLGFFTRENMVKEFSDAAFKLNAGELSDVVQSEFGYHIIKVTDKKAATNPTFEEKKDDVRKILLNKELATKVPTWIQEIQTAAKIDNKLEAKEKATETSGTETK